MVQEGGRADEEFRGGYGRGLSRRLVVTCSGCEFGIGRSTKRTVRGVVNGVRDTTTTTTTTTTRSRLHAMLGLAHQRVPVASGQYRCRQTLFESKPRSTNRMPCRGHPFPNEPLLYDRFHMTGLTILILYTRPTLPFSMNFLTPPPSP
jgi:hypothetical protein